MSATLPTASSSLQQSPLKFEINARHNKARAAILTLHHGAVKTPVFMPVGTQATVKGLTSQQLRDLDFEILLGQLV